MWEWDELGCTRFIFWGNENVLGLDTVMAAQFCEYTKITELYPLKWKILWYMNYLNNTPKEQASIGVLTVYLTIKQKLEPRSMI